MNTCGHCGSTDLILTDEQTTVCTQCAVECRAPYSCTYATVGYQQSFHPHPVMDNSYSRVKRFLTILDNVCLGCVSLSDNKMLEYLDKQKNGAVWCFEDVIRTMKASPLRDKRYNCLHLFNRVYADDYIKPKLIDNWFFFRKRIAIIFESVEHTHQRLFHSRPFMSYTWLLYKLLELFEHTDYLKYIKVLKCPKRTLVYETNFRLIKHELRRLDKFAAVQGVFANCARWHAEHADGHGPLPAQSCVV